MRTAYTKINNIIRVSLENATKPELFRYNISLTIFVLINYRAECSDKRQLDVRSGVKNEIQCSRLRDDDDTEDNLEFLNNFLLSAIKHIFCHRWSTFAQLCLRLQDEASFYLCTMFYEAKS